MELPEFLTGESVARLFQGAIAGAVGTMALGFGYGGWMLGSTAMALVEKSSAAAVVAAVAPICADQFRRSADFASNTVELKKTASWQQSTFIEKGGWAVMPGAKTADYGVTQACAALLGEAK